MLAVYAMHTLEAEKARTGAGPETCARSGGDSGGGYSRLLMNSWRMYQNISATDANSSSEAPTYWSSRK